MKTLGDAAAMEPHAAGGVRRVLLAALGCCALAVAGLSGPAAAAPFGRDSDFRQGMQARRVAPGPQRETERRMPQRELRGADEGERGRMSPEERRQLRRDIQDAGRDIYRPAQQDPRDPLRGKRR